MRTRLYALLLLFLFASSVALSAQSAIGNASGNCTGSAMDTSEDCAADQTSSSLNQNSSSPNAQAQGQSNATGENNGLSTRSTTSPTSEDTSIAGQPRTRSTQQTSPLPADPLTEFQKFVAATTGQVLPVYGANLFRNVPTTFSPDDLAPVTSSYVIGPEDELRVRIWGQITYSGNLRVDRSGNIYLPQAGAVHVAGLQFSALDQHLRAAVGRVYRNFDLSVDIGRIRSMQVYVTGQARRPGVYTVSSLSTLVDALFASGGPAPQGSLRHILLKREGKIVADFDLYALLVEGDKSKDVHLLPEDVLYISAVGTEVAITGSIRAPGIYELRTGESLGELLETAGKTTALSSSERVLVDRAGEGQMRQAAEFSMDASGLATTLRDGDIIRINPILPAYENTVILRGNVANPGRFAFKPGMHLSDLIPDRASLMSRDYWWKRSHLGLPVPEFESSISTMGRSPRTQEWNRLGFTAEVSPETLTKALVPPDPADSDSGSLANENYSQFADQNPYGNQTNQNLYGNQTTLNPYGNQTNQNLYGNQMNQSAANNQVQRAGSGSLGSLTLQDRTTNPEDQKRNRVRVSTPEIDWDFAVIERLDPQTLRTSLISFDLGKLVNQKDAGQDLALQAGDTITIFSQADIHVPLAGQTKYVELEGEVVHAGVYSVQPGETLRDVVRRAGGLTPNAYLYGSEFRRESTRILQQQRIDEYVRSVDLEVTRGALMAANATALSSAQSASASALGVTPQDKFLARLREIRATGRVVLKMKPESAGLDDVPAISLENKDHFIVPSVLATVNVVGAVYNQNSFLYESRGKIESYLQMAGGATRNADAHRMYVIRADGSVIGRDAVKGYWGDAFKHMHLNPGETLVVPDKNLRPGTTLKTIMDWTTMFSQLAVGAAVASNL
jgi:protein involved in polysaccharide export with SLBB domain